jgi:catalase (peroxidase I)
MGVDLPRIITILGMAQSPYTCAIAAALPLLPAHADAPQGAPQSASYWWPDHRDPSPLRQHDERSNPPGADFDYARAFAKRDLNAVKADVHTVLTRSQ